MDAARPIGPEVDAAPARRPERRAARRGASCGWSRSTRRRTGRRCGGIVAGRRSPSGTIWAPGPSPPGTPSMAGCGRRRSPRMRCSSRSIDGTSGRALGWASLMRIVPADGAIEVGNILFGAGPAAHGRARRRAMALLAGLRLRRRWAMAALRVEVQRAERAVAGGGGSGSASRSRACSARHMVVKGRKPRTRPGISMVDRGMAGALGAAFARLARRPPISMARVAGSGRPWPSCGRPTAPSPAERVRRREWACVGDSPTHAEASEARCPASPVPWRRQPWAGAGLPPSASILARRPEKSIGFAQ